MIAGSTQAGYVDGNQVEAKFNNIRGLCFSSDGNELFISDSGNHRIRKLDSLGNISTYAGSGLKGRENKNLLGSSFNSPSGLCLWKQGHLCVADTGNGLIRLISDDQVVTLAGSGLAATFGGSFQSASFLGPHTLRSGFYGELLVASKPLNAGHSLSLLFDDEYVVTDAFNQSGLAPLDVIPCIPSSSYYTVLCDERIEPLGTLYVVEELRFGGVHTTMEPMCTLVPKRSSSLPPTIKDTHDQILQPQVESISLFEMSEHPVYYGIGAVQRYLDALYPALSGTLKDQEEDLVALHLAREDKRPHNLDLRSTLRVSPNDTISSAIRVVTPMGTLILVGPDENVVDPQSLVGDVLKRYQNMIEIPFVPHPLFRLCHPTKDLCINHATKQHVHNLEWSLELTVTGGFTLAKLAQLISLHTSIPASDIFVSGTHAVGLIDWKYLKKSSNVFNVEVQLRDSPSKGSAQVCLFSGETWEVAKIKVLLAAGVSHLDHQRFSLWAVMKLENERWDLNPQVQVGQIPFEKLSHLAVEESPPITIYLITMNGGRNSIEGCSTMTGLDIKERSHVMLKTTVADMRLLCGGRQIQDDKTLADYKLGDSAYVNLMVVIRRP